MGLSFRVLIIRYPYPLRSLMAMYYSVRFIVLFYQMSLFITIIYTYTCDNNYFFPWSWSSCFGLLPPLRSVSQTKQSSAARCRSALKIRLWDSNKTMQTEGPQSIFLICKYPILLDIESISITVFKYNVHFSDPIFNRLERVSCTRNRLSFEYPENWTKNTPALSFLWLTQIRLRFSTYL